MGMVIEYIKHIYAAFAIIPVLAFAAILYGYGAYSKDRKKALRLAMDVTTVFLIGVVAALFNYFIGNKFGIYGILLVMLLGGGLIGNAQFRKRGSVDVKRIFKMIWRLSFFVMSLLYIVLMIVAFGKIVASV